MQIDRTTILTGPALVTYAGSTFWSKGNITIKPTFESFKVETSFAGEVDTRYSSKSFEISFEPDGRFTSGLAAILWPYAATQIGASVYGGSDRALVVHGRDGKKFTFHNAALTGMPNFMAGVSKTIQGSCKFTAILANSTDPTNAAAYYTYAPQAYPGDTGWASSDILTKGFDSAWGSAPWNAFQTEAGWELAFNLQLAAQKADGLGVVDMTLQGLTVTAKAIPVGPTINDVMTKLGHTEALGASRAASGANLVISATGIHAYVYKAAMTESEGIWGTQAKRIGTTTWQAMRSVTAGSLDPLFYIGTTAPA